MPKSTTEYRENYSTESSDETMDHDTKVDILTRYIDRLAEENPQFLHDLTVLKETKGRDQTDWLYKFATYDVAVDYKQAFNYATKDITGGERDYAAKETAQIISSPLESVLEDMDREVTYYRPDKYDKDVLDPQSHRELLHHTRLISQEFLEDSRSELAQALSHGDTQDTNRAFNYMGLTKVNAENARNGYAIPNVDNDDIDRIVQHRLSLMHHRFLEHLTNEHPDISADDANNPDFQEAFRDFSQSYLPGDVDRLAHHYAQEAPSNEILDAYENLTKQPSQTPQKLSYREWLQQPR